MSFWNIFVLTTFKWTMLFFVSTTIYASLGPDGVDWAYYSTVKPDYQNIYFQREIFAWVLIDIVNSIDTSGVLMAGLVSSLLTIGTINLSLVLTRDLAISTLLTIMLFLSNFYLLMSVNGLRQGISLGLLLIALSHYHKSSKNFLFFFVLAVFSHNSAVVFGPLFLVRKVPTFIYFSGIVILMISGEIIISVAVKNNNPSVTQNKQIFLLLSLLVCGAALLHWVSKKLKPLLRLKQIEFIKLVIYIFSISTAFYSSSAVYERIVYTSVPLLVIYSGAFLTSYRPRIIAVSVLGLVVFLFCGYSLLHPSVRNNFLNL